jgi:putative ABC transport system permease protein
MLEVVNVTKTYGRGENAVEALNGVSLRFRNNEFVSVLGHSGCGKTTLLNIIGGLDHYTSGDLIINGTSTRYFTDGDWDTYRNHSIGFVFQSYNLIPHQSILSNVELALTLAGINRHERRRRACEALEQVGLGNQLHKKPNQLSGGQMQRVAIARALVNNPDILLADEPTGALDSETSVQIMNLLKEIAQKKLVIMVTHNPELAEEYSTRIIRLADGLLVDDTNPYDGQEYNVSVARPRGRRTSMGLFTALSLSFSNLMTKKGRTFLTSFAGSIGIIGIALILAVSTGVSAYINDIERNTMTSYPISIQQNTIDTSSMLSSLMQNQDNKDRDPNKVYSSDVMIQMMSSMTTSITTNNLKDFKAWIDNNPEFLENCADIKYSYSTDLNTYLKQPDGSYKNSSAGMDELFDDMGGVSKDMLQGMSAMMGSMGSVTGWTELVGTAETIQKDYEIVDGKYPEAINEVVLIVDKNNQVSDYTLYALGIRNTDELKEYMKHAMQAYLTGTENTYKIPATEYTFAELYSYEFKVMLDSDEYILEDGVVRKLLHSNADDRVIINQRLNEAQTLKIVGIVRPKDDTMAASSIGTIGYLPKLVSDIIDKSNSSDVVMAQINNPEVDVFTGLRFDATGYTLDDFKMIVDMINKYPESLSIKLLMAMFPNNKDIISNYAENVPLGILQKIIDKLNEGRVTTNTYDGNLKKLGWVDTENPSYINIYPKDFEAKERINELIAEYNAVQSKENKIVYTDTISILLSSVTTILDAISYVLIAFVSISLVVSSIMIGIITYISVLERTKEIGILRAMGASKRDVGRIFNAETIVVGFVAGLLGIGISLILIAITNVILLNLTGISNLQAALNPIAAVALIGVSVVLTLIAGLFPAGTASRQDPVVALRSE